MAKAKSQTEKISMSGKLGKISVPLSASFVIVMLMILFLLLLYMKVYPEYQSSIMGNDTFPPSVKIFIASIPVIIFIIIIITWIILSAMGFLRSNDKKEKE